MEFNLVSKNINIFENLSEIQKYKKIIIFSKFIGKSKIVKLKCNKYKKNI